MGSQFPFNSVRLAQGSGELDVQARESVTLTPPFNPTVSPSSYINLDNTGAVTYNYSFFTYVAGGAAASFSLRSAASDISVENHGSTFGSTGLTDTTALESMMTVLPPKVRLVSFGASLSGIYAAVDLYPSPSGQLQLLADHNITGFNLTMSQADAAQVPSLTKPADLVYVPLGDPLGNPIVGATPLHANDKQPAEVVARTGSLVDINLNIPKAAEIL